jgi:outer membrane protein assembly factor BamB
VSPSAGMPGGMLSLSSDAVSPSGDVIVWATHPKDDAWSPKNPVDGVVYAFDGADVSKLLWRSDTRKQDEVGEYSKFTAPTIANGHVYVATFSGQVQVYGLCPAGGCK